ncbi:Tetratricopeptide repeat protein [Anatilimnocola aggregata]|uniref:Tetratricopeptide repeat protein n=2 Tax=Anatilimnocola aggregata TaxID=2528021 RepID=A0A517Y5H0_9BACT|nr:Tetratricopeptide repeat protein [Anatilimnocola aggregata]
METCLCLADNCEKPVGRSPRLNRATRFERLIKLLRGDSPASTIVYARRFLARYPHHGPGWMTFGIALIETAHYAEARAALETALKFCPPAKQHRIFCQFGHLCRSEGDLHQAAGWFRRAVKLYPHEADTYIFLGGTLARLGYLRSAELIHRRGTECAEGCVDEAYLNLGLVLRAQGRYAEAAECCYQAIRIDPNYCAAKQLLRDVQRAERWTRPKD